MLRRTLLSLASLGLFATPAPAEPVRPASEKGAAPVQPEVGTRAKRVIVEGALKFRDSDGDGRLSPFEDWRLTPEARARDLVGRMTADEKVGTLLHATLPGANGVLGRGAGYDFAAAEDLISGRKITSFITRLGTSPADLARENNRAQEVAERGRLGIPLTISSDPRNHFQYVLGASGNSSGTTQWPEALGFAALRDPARVRQFAAIARKEYRAVGITMALSPQLDLFTEPRWPRGTGTFGSDPALVSVLGEAYVEGLQGSAAGLAPNGVATVVKHWVGYGAQPEGFDGHNHYGRFARPGALFWQHVAAFAGALAVKPAGLMPAYPIIEGVTVAGRPVEAVGPGYSKVLLKDLLRAEKGYRGMILSDWGITRTCNERCRAPTAEAPQQPQDIAMSWGVEDLSVEERYARGMAAGIDQFGGTDDVTPLLAALHSGKLAPATVDEAVRRVLEIKFAMGLFENPYVDPDRAAREVGTPADVALANRTQREAQVLLRNSGQVLPFRTARKVWLFGMDPAAAKAAGLTVVADPAEADFAVVRAETPSEKLHPNHFFGSRQKEGRLDFRPGDHAYEALRTASARVPTVLAIFMDRPAVLTTVTPFAKAILVNFGASDAAVLDVVLGKAKARGRLPFQLPRSMEQVRRQDPGRPDDIPDPLYPRGAGIILP
ncbi:glycoside hydrolase family 3 C-terminal domain-containing protein [Novosphingobium flavum]|uniref:glycoside hydrolase family 3 protein n=1 Tax=Novosphingobium aerophilum TaxID=2839843 RepID=UPI00163B444E|nr:glycoside hydrolase family 3 N-terminal domain-containing protein [Novosphingobium aerophilum]MBC2663511.1 glycoside hydrolase family 3 C-terminal domain-containing protein [Novosphingobium aerophilum]